ncbi:hypothetical protein F5144DRAFT_233746 [Chaetomium tenue]|uniref:Uncharacterized protein n=1 Tax=Chaetomium tenue TaxID=1854479 RepID=A0ACB7P7E3_9PEZI|nr:hypothetical protein F5144DRAFT_233746 [Chaetomium globosum]
MGQFCRRNWGSRWSIGRWATPRDRFVRPIECIKQRLQCESGAQRNFVDALEVSRTSDDVSVTRLKRQVSGWTRKLPSIGAGNQGRQARNHGLPPPAGRARPEAWERGRLDAQEAKDNRRCCAEPAESESR